MCSVYRNIGSEERSNQKWVLNRARNNGLNLPGTNSCTQSILGSGLLGLDKNTCVKTRQQDLYPALVVNMSSQHPANPTPYTPIKTRLLILSDTHSALPGPLNSPHLPFSLPFPQADVAIHSGDLTSTGTLTEHLRALTLLHSLPAPLKLVIPGNHDLTLDRAYCATHPILYGWKRPHNADDLRAAHDLYTNKEATDAGISYVVEGTHSFALPNGAKLTVYVSAYTPEFCDWGFAYPRDVDRFNDAGEQVSEHPVNDYDELGGSQCTVVITHGPPKGVLDQTTQGENAGCDHLMRAVGRCRPLLHCFGHIHEGWGTERKVWPQQPEKANLESIEPVIKQDEEISRKKGWMGEELEKRDNVQKNSRQTVAKERRVLERKTQPADKEVVVETRGSDPVPLTEQQQESVGYLDVSTVRHGTETVFVNASIMDVQYNPCQKPWVVDLMLPAATEEEKRDPKLSIYLAREPQGSLKEL